MSVFVSWFLIILFYGIFNIKVYEIISNRKICLNFSKMIMIIIYAIVNVIIIFILGEKYKMIFTIILGIAFIYIISKDNIVKIIVSFIMITLSFAISEASFYLFLIIIPNMNILYFSNNPIGITIVNMYTLLFSRLIFNNKYIKNWCNKLYEWCSFNKKIKIVLLFILTIVVLAYFLYKTFTSNLSSGYILFTLIFMIGIVTFIIGFFYEKAKNNSLKYKYDQLYDYARTYETELAEKSKSQHEHRNQLVIIKNLIDTDTKEAISYIEKIMNKDLTNKNLYWLNKLINIPYGGLKGLIYYKIMEMVNKNFEIYINISEKLCKKSLWKIYEDNAQDITRIIGVYIDNAIEAANLAEDKFFILDVLYENDNIEFVFSNTYTNDIDINKLDKEGYSSKGKGRGYGLSLVKDILDNNINLSQEREINGKLYVQKLIIKTK